MVQKRGLTSEPTLDYDPETGSGEVPVPVFEPCPLPWGYPVIRSYGKIQKTKGLTAFTGLDFRLPFCDRIGSGQAS